MYAPHRMGTTEGGRDEGLVSGRGVRGQSRDPTRHWQVSMREGGEATGAAQVWPDQGSEKMSLGR